jgi:hypothetical protein
MLRRSWPYKALMAVLATLLIVALGNAPANSAARQSEPLTVEDILRLNPGAEKINDHTVKIAEGINLILPPPKSADSPQPLVTQCGNWPAVYHLCVWEHQLNAVNGPGWGLDFYHCDNDDVNLGYLRYPDGRRMDTYVQGARWNDRISSFVNNQSWGTTAYFYDWRGSWATIFRSIPFDRRANLALDRAWPSGEMGGANDQIDRVDPC